MNNKKIKFSVNPSLIDKIPPQDERTFRDGFQPVEDTLEGLAEAISEDGWAFSYQFSGSRAASNFAAADFIAIDIDGGTTISETMALPIVQNHCSMMYTTASHTPESHRFRLIFLLPRTITKANELTAAAKALTRRVGGDIKATDAGRLFYGSRGSSPELYDRQLSEDILNELIADGKTAQVNDSIANANTTANRSAVQFDPDLQVKTRTGHWITTSEVDKTTSIFCPFHPDRSPSAFISKTPRGGTYIHCSSCQMTWWMKGSVLPRYDFYGFDAAIQSTSIKTPFEQLIDVTGIHPDNVHVSSERFLEIPKLDDGITLIKSPKGSGKTKFLSDAIVKVIYPFATLEEYEKATDFETELPMVSRERVLLIGHRRALIGELCERLHLNCYLDDKEFRPGEISERKRRYGVCLDSLREVRQLTYDIIVIDEVEQVLAHFMSETMGEKRMEIFRLFCHLIRDAKKVVALDADLGWVTFVTLTMLARSNALGTRELSKEVPLHVYLNDYRMANRALLVYSSLGQMTANLMANIVDGKRVFVASNSKEKIKGLELAIKQMAKDAGLDLPLMSITSENSREEDIQQFIKNIKDEILKYKVILSSPSLGTGIDITFDNEAQEIDAVYGVFENRINSHFEIDQQLARVRHPKEVHVWISPQQFNFETEFGIVRDDYLHDRMIDIIDDGALTTKAGSVFNGIDPFYVMAAMITTHQRASKNRLKKNFLDYKQRQGWTVTHVALDESLADEGNEIIRMGKMIKRELDIERVVNSRTMNQYEYVLFQRRKDSNDGQIDPDEWHSYFRTRIELFYGQAATTQVVTDDQRGKFSRAVRMFEELEQFSGLDHVTIPDDLHSRLFKSRTVGAKLLHILFMKTPFYREGKFDPSVVFTKDELTDFVVDAKRLDAMVTTHLDVSTRADIDEKPTNHVTNLLKTVGLQLDAKKPKVTNGVKTYFYSVSGHDLKGVLDVVERRKDPSKISWSFVNGLHGFQYSPDEMDVMYS